MDKEQRYDKINNSLIDDYAKKREEQLNVLLNESKLTQDEKEEIHDFFMTGLTDFKCKFRRS